MDNEVAQAESEHPISEFCGQCPCRICDNRDLIEKARRETAREAWGWMKNRLRMYGHGGEAEEMVRDFGADFGLEDGDGK